LLKQSRKKGLIIDFNCELTEMEDFEEIEEESGYEKANCKRWHSGKLAF